MDVFFPDGRPFHVMSFSEQGHQDEHWCDPDDYRVSYTLRRAGFVQLHLGRAGAREGSAARYRT